MEDTSNLRFRSFNEMKATFYLGKHSDINEFILQYICKRKLVLNSIN